MKSTDVYRFGDLLALARQSWIRQMARGLHARGYEDYRMTDAATMRRLLVAPMSIGRLGAALGISRQAARKVADGLKARGFAVMERDAADTRQVNVILTDAGEAYARAVTMMIRQLNRDLARRVNRSDLVSADTVLRAVLSDQHTKNLAESLDPPNGGA